MPFRFIKKILEKNSRAEREIRRQRRFVAHLELASQPDSSNNRNTHENITSISELAPQPDISNNRNTHENITSISFLVDIGSSPDCTSLAHTLASLRTQTFKNW